MDLTQRRVIAFAAVTTWFAIDAVRTSGPLLSDLFDIGVEVAAGVGFTMFIAGGVLAAALVSVTRRWAPTVLTLAAAAVAIRLVLPFLNEGTLIAAGVLMTTLALALALTTARLVVVAGGGPALGIAMGLGTSLAVIEQVVVRTHDAVWRNDLLGWALMVIVGAALVWLAWSARSVGGDKATKGWWAHGLYFSLVLYAIGNIAFVNSQSGLRMSASLLVIVAGLLAGAYLSSQLSHMSGVMRTTIVLAVIPSVAVTMLAQGMTAMLALPVLAASATVAIAVIVRATEGTVAVGRHAGAGAAWGVLALLPFMLIQLDYDIPLGFPHMFTMVIAMLAVTVVAIMRVLRVTALPQSGRLLPLTLGVVGVLAICIGVGTYLKYEQPRSYTLEFIGEPTVMSWNVHYGVTPSYGGGPGVDLGEMASVIAEVDPDILMLQEVDRGWILAGGVDILEYMAGVFPMEFAFTPAHDHQFGNAVFANRPISNVQSFQLPYGDGPQRRGVVAADYMGVTYAVAHLQHKERDDTRVAQAESLLTQLQADGPVVVAGDFNDVPDSRAVRTMLEAGFVSAQDWAGFEAPTYVTADTQTRIDYIFGRDVVFLEFHLLDHVLWSDHLPLVVIITTE